MAFCNENDAAFCNPETLPVSVRQIISGKGLVQVPCIIGTMADFDYECAHVSALLHGKPKEAWEAHRKSILEGVLEDDGQDLFSIQSQYTRYPGPPRVFPLSPAQYDMVNG